MGSIAGSTVGSSVGSAVGGMMGSIASGATKRILHDGLGALREFLEE